MRKRKLLVVIALVLFALFQAEVASACAREAKVFRVLLQSYGINALIYLSLVDEPDAAADMWMETNNIAIIQLALAGVHNYGLAYFESDANVCPASGSAGKVTFAAAAN